MQTHRTWVFSPLDLVMPIGTGLVAVALCAWGAFKAETVPAVVVCIITGTVFLASIPLWYLARSIKRRFDTKIEGVFVTYGRWNRPSKFSIESWVKELVSHWTKARWTSNGKLKALTPLEVREALEGSSVFFVDAEKLTIFGRLARGYAWGRDCVIGYRKGDPAYVRSLFIHEASHVVLGHNGESWDEKKHHAIFRVTGLPE